MRRTPRALVALAAVVLLAKCADGEGEDVRGPGWDWERMVEQPRYDAYEATELFPDGTIMRPPPEGTVPRHRVTGPPEWIDGLTGGQPVERIPIALDRERLESGRHHFDVFCAACHGRSGTARTPVAEAMEMRPPPSLLEERIRELPDGRLYRVVRDGYGLMPGYGPDLSVDERWAVVAYVRALQWSQGVPAEELPPAMRRELAVAAGEGRP